jgi:hypothetical protein
MYKIITAFLLLLTVQLLFSGGCQTDSGQFNGEGNTSVVLNVDDVAADPAAYSGVIAVKGIVSLVNRFDNTFDIIDVREFELCGIVTCATNQLLVSVPPDGYSGELPVVEDEVVAYGKIVNNGDGYSIEVLEVKRDNKVLLKQIQG